MNQEIINNSDKKNSTLSSFSRFFDIIMTLRGPEGCEEKNEENLKEELGDLFLLITMIAYMKEQDNTFTLREVFDEISEKLIRRHPHVFGDSSLKEPDEVIEQWNEIKKNEKGEGHTDSILDSVSRTLPPLERALLIQKEVSRVGFDWTDENDVWGKVKEEMEELREACKKEDTHNMESELGDLIFSIINLSRFLNIDPALSLHKTNRKFVKRFKEIEQKLKEMDKKPSIENFEIMDNLWNESK